MSAPASLVAVFTTADDLLAALRRARAAGLTHLDAYVPQPIEELDELVPQRPTPIGWIVFAAGMTGAAGAYFLQWYAAHDFPINVGGRPLTSWPAFIPVTFELGVLTAAIVGVLALCALCRLPRLDHPMFELPGFEHASQDRFFLRVRTDDPHYRAAEIRGLLGAANAESIEEVAP